MMCIVSSGMHLIKGEGSGDVLKMLDLFSGIGGMSLAADMAGIETVAFCEIDPFCKSVLKKHWSDIPIFNDIRELNREVLQERGIDEIDIVAGGFPCQPFSTMGKRQGRNDNRDLWGEMFRIISELKPTWVVGENVANFAFMELQRTLSDLESHGYEAETFIIPACATDVRHRRDRTFVVAHSMCRLLSTQQEGEYQDMGQGQNAMAYGKEQFLGRWSQGEIRRKAESRICGRNDGVSNRMDTSRLKALGNSVVPQQVYPIFQAIMNVI